MPQSPQQVTKLRTGLRTSRPTARRSEMSALVVEPSQPLRVNTTRLDCCTTRYCTPQPRGKQPLPACLSRAPLKPYSTALALGLLSPPAFDKGCMGLSPLHLMLPRELSINSRAECPALPDTHIRASGIAAPRSSWGEALNKKLQEKGPRRAHQYP